MKDVTATVKQLVDLYYDLVDRGEMDDEIIEMQLRLSEAVQELTGLSLGIGLSEPRFVKSH